MHSLNEVRNNLQSSQCQFVEPADFVNRLTSRNRLIRSDEPEAEAYGLLDQDTGFRILVLSEKLMNYMARNDRASLPETEKRFGLSEMTL